MKKEFMINKAPNAIDIYPLYYGCEDCKPNQGYGPASRREYLVHFCLSGCGYLLDKYGRHEVSAGELFIMRPNEITTYCSDAENPWEYSWIAFNGNMANVFNTKQSVYKISTDIGNDLKSLAEQQETSNYLLTSIIFKLMFYCFNTKNDKQLSTDTSEVADAITRFININFAFNIKISDIALQYGYDRSYLFKIFKKHTGLSIKQYIVKIRMDQAKRLLENGYSVSNTAFAVGYSDEFNFSKIFKKYYGKSPASYKQSKNSKQEPKV